MAIRRFACCLLLGAACAAGAGATSYVMVSDEDLVAQASLIVEATVTGVAPAPTPRPATDHLLRVERVLKGETYDAELVLRAPGGVGPDGRELILFGAPRLAPGERGLFFLRPGADSTFRSLHLMLGTFQRVTLAERQLAARNLSGTVELGWSGQPAAEPSDVGRDYAAFRLWIERRGAGVPAAADYIVQLSPDEEGELRHKFGQIRFQSTPTRWFDFDGGGQVVWHAEAGGQPGMTGGGFAEVEQALAAWSHEPGSSIRMVYGGTIGSGQGFSAPDRRNVVHFADPHGDLEDEFVCGSGGVLAIGGPWAVASARRSFQGRSYVPILEGDVITNKGLECFLNNRSAAMAEMIAHEVGHALGLGHSCGDPEGERCRRGTLKDDALMRATIHDDGRGARLGADDVAAVRFLYALGDDCGGGTAAGGRVLCLHGGRFRLEVSWENQFNGTAGSGRAIPSSDFAGFFYFDDPRNVELMVKLLDFGDRILFFDGQLTNLLFAITVTDTHTGEVKVYRNGPENCGEIDGEAFAGTGASGQTLTGVADKASGSCQPGATRLCLLERRIAVDLTWRNQFNDASGSGRAEPLSDLTGSFSFDDPRNLEVLIKALDFGDRILVLWGSLSNLEYALQVTDTATGATRRYENPAGRYCGGLDEHAF